MQRRHGPRHPDLRADEAVVDADGGEAGGEGLHRGLQPQFALGVGQSSRQGLIGTGDGGGVEVPGQQGRSGAAGIAQPVRPDQGRRLIPFLRALQPSILVNNRAAVPGDYVTPQTAITTIDDLSRMKLDFQVPERFLRRVHVGTSFLIRSRSMDSDKAIAGEVYFVSSVINPDTRSSEVKGYLTNPPVDLKPGMFANVELVLAVHKAVLTVPEGSIFNSSKGPQVVVIRTGTGNEPTADFVPVTLGLRSKGLVEIQPVKKDTVLEKESVVASGVGALILFQGAKLAPRPLRNEFRIDGVN
jgi:hypothetical protein